MYQILFIIFSASAVFLWARPQQDAFTDDVDLNCSLSVHYNHSSRSDVPTDGHFSDWFASSRKWKYHRTTETRPRRRQHISHRCLNVPMSFQRCEVNSSGIMGRQPVSGFHSATAIDSAGCIPQSRSKRPCVWRVVWKYTSVGNSIGYFRGGNITKPLLFPPLSTLA